MVEVDDPSSPRFVFEVVLVFEVVFEVVFVFVFEVCWEVLNRFEFGMRCPHRLAPEVSVADAGVPNRNEELGRNTD
jgi:hypothetical protein